MRTSYIFIFCALLYSGFVFTACSSTPEPKNTAGQELMDLKNARNNGAINHDEYEDQKEAILDRHED